MKGKNIVYVMGIGLALTLAGLLASKPDRAPVSGMIIFTQVLPGTTGYNANKARIVAITPEDDQPHVLTDGFYAARAPELSCDAHYIIFSGKKTQGEPWQIWKMNIGNKKAEKIFDCKVDCTDPAFLPDGHIVYSKMIDIGKELKGFALFTCATDGTGHRQITFHPHDDLMSSIMQDGRILFLSQERFPSKNLPQMIAMRPNGTKARLFYINPENTQPISRGKETQDGKMIFAETSNPDQMGGDLVSISLNRPLHSRELLSNDAAYLAAYPLKSGKLIVSCKTSDSKTFNLYEFDPLSKKRGKMIYSNPAYWSIEPVSVYERLRPKKLPDDLVCSDMTGRILCLDANASDMPPLNGSENTSKGTIIQVMGIEGQWGEVPLEDDGSFFLRLTADKPLRFRTVNETGNVVRGPSAWVWVRPHERRGCVGCHEDRELAPKNKRPTAIANLPVEVLAPGTRAGEEIIAKSEKTGK